MWERWDGRLDSERGPPPADADEMPFEADAFGTLMQILAFKASGREGAEERNRC